MEDFVVFENVCKTYRSGDVEVSALRDASFTIGKGEIVVIVGQSGAGKTTLLNILGGMDTLTSGRVLLDGREISAFKRRELAHYRRSDVGFVFQFYNLIGNLTALENVEMAARLEKGSRSAAEVLREVGLGDRMQNFPAQLSGGEQQRVAIARALVKNPRLLLCDEPTGALDYETGKTILSLLQRTCKEHGTTAIIITHNHALCPMANRVIHVRNGSVVSCKINPSPTPIEQIEW